MFFAVVFLSLVSLSMAFYFSDLVLIYVSGSAALIIGLISLKDLLSVKDILDDEVAENIRTPPSWLTSFGLLIGELINVLRYRQDNLEWEVSSAPPSSGIQYSDFVHLLTDLDQKNFYQELMKLISKNFRCSSCAVVFEGSEEAVILLGEKDLRLEKSLELFFKEYFVSGATDKLGVRDSGNDQACLGDPISFGYSYSLSGSFLDSSGDAERKGIVWLGYKDPPLTLERAWLSDLCNMLEGELAAFRRVEALSNKVKDIENASQQKNTFISHISHDIRSPINNVKSILHVLKLEGLNDENRQFLEVALNNCDSASEIVEDLLDYTRHQAGALKANFEEVNVSELIEQVVSNYQYSAQLKNLELNLYTPEENFWALGDRLQIKRIFSNLIGNAVKYTEVGKVSVSIENFEGIIELSITDSGIGMSEDQLAQIFTPFTRFTSKTDGIGLGLVLSKILLEKNLGDIKVSSVLGEGSDFRITLPSLEVEENKHELGEKLSDVKQIVFADDNSDLVASMKRGFESKGWIVYPAYNSDEVIHLAKKHELDAVVTDNKMPGGGAQKILESQNDFKSIPLIFVVSGSSEDSIRSSLIDLGADEVLQKPITSTELIDIILRKDRSNELGQAA